MTAPILMTDCPTEETLASYLDDRLDHETRKKVTEHLASCGECKELVLMATDYQENEANVRRGTFGSRRLAAAAGLAAAAALGFFMLRPALFGPTLDDVIEASRTLSHRPSIGRLAGDFPHGEASRIVRGDGGDSPSNELAEKAGAYQVAYKADGAKFPDLHVLGVTRLLVADDKAAYDRAVAALVTAYEKARGEQRDSIAIDLAASLLERSRLHSTPGDSERALDLSNEVLTRKPRPEAAWNRAIALESLGRDPEAVRAWDEYLKLDPSSEWAKDATNRKAGLTERD